MRNGIMKKLRANRGETLAETLMAALVSALALVMLAGAMSAARTTILKSEEKMSAYYGADAAMVGRPGDSVIKISVEIESIPNPEMESVTQIFEEVPLYSNGVFTNSVVYSYGAGTPDEGDGGLTPP